MLEEWNELKKVVIEEFKETKLHKFLDWLSDKLIELSRKGG